MANGQDISGDPLSTPEIAAEEAALSHREWIWLSVTALCLLAVYVSPLAQHLTHLQEMRAALAGMGRWAPLVFILAMTGITAIGFPRMLMYPVAGLVFGFFWGILWSMIATVAGAYLTFVYARWAGQGVVLKKWPKVAELSRVLRNRGFLTIALLRQLPGPGFLINLLLGVSPVRHRAFLGGTALGALPSAIPATLIGNSISHHSSSIRLFSIAASLLCLIAVWTLFSFYFKRSAYWKELRHH